MTQPLAFAPTDPGYEEARQATMWNRLVPERYPARIVQARTDQDVVDAVRAAGRDGRAVSVRSGGHSWPGNHVRDDVVLIDVSALDSVVVDADRMTAVVGPGKGGSVLLEELLAVGLFFPVGHCEGVCVGGYLLQGGFGWNGRALGMACENVIAIDYVDAAGDIRHASETENEEMLWAARGAGPGFFGVVLRFHLRLFPRPGFIGAASLSYPAERLDEVFDWADRVGPEVPDSVELDLLLSAETPGVRGLGIHVAALVFDTDWRAARAANAFLSTAPRSARLPIPTTPFAMRRMYRNAMTHYPDNHRWCVDNMWTHAGWPALRDGVTAIAQSLPTAPSHLLWMNWYPPQRPDMAFSVEDDVYIALYGSWTDPVRDDENTAWVTDRLRALESHATGVQLADENLGRRPQRFVAEANLARLDALRAAHDPERRFLEWMGRP